MGWWESIKAAFAIIGAINAFRREYEEQGAARLSPEAAQRDRRRLQKLAIDFEDKQNSGLRALTKIDDGVAEYLRDLLDSDLLTIYLSPKTSMLDRQMARKRIMDEAEPPVITGGDG
ncbi:MAG: hypothetical protein LLG01_00710 [Planctomycetaceae bacterium]|nr:hypothetical protein [Planctomycetaceae bacterium]